MQPSRSWHDLAACRGVDPDLFFPQRGESLDPARAICATCPVRVDCLEEALARKEEFGVWGGMSTGERKTLLAMIEEAVEVDTFVSSV